MLFGGIPLKFIEIDGFPPLLPQKGAWGAPGAPDLKGDRNSYGFRVVFGGPEPERGRENTKMSFSNGNPVISAEITKFTLNGGF